MQKEYVMKCSNCYYLLPLEDFDSKYINSKLNDERLLVKKKTCRECLWSVSESHSRFILRHGMTSYRYRLNKN